MAKGERSIVATANEPSATTDATVVVITMEAATPTGPEWQSNNIRSDASFDVDAEVLR